MCQDTCAVVNDGKKESFLLYSLQEVINRLKSNIGCDDDIARAAEKSVVCQSNSFYEM